MSNYQMIDDAYFLVYLEDHRSNLVDIPMSEAELGQIADGDSAARAADHSPTIPPTAHKSVRRGLRWIFER